jgi:hypothetical protein
MRINENTIFFINLFLMTDTTPPNFYLVLNSLSQVPEFDFSSSTLPWKPCAIAVIKSTPSHIINKDTYITKLARYFLVNNIICSDELSLSIPYCHPLWLALHISNTMKEKPNHNYVNKYLHPVTNYSTKLHTTQHALKKHAEDLLTTTLLGTSEHSKSLGTKPQ